MVGRPSKNPVLGMTAIALVGASFVGAPRRSTPSL